MKEIEVIISPAKLDAARTQVQRSGIYFELIVTLVEQTNGFRLAEGECAESPQGRLKVESMPETGRRKGHGCSRAVCSSGIEVWSESGRFARS